MFFFVICQWIEVPILSHASVLMTICAPKTAVLDYINKHIYSSINFSYLYLHSTYNAILNTVPEADS